MLSWNRCKPVLFNSKWGKKRKNEAKKQPPTKFTILYKTSQLKTKFVKKFSSAKMTLLSTLSCQKIFLIFYILRPKLENFQRFKLWQISQVTTTFKKFYICRFWSRDRTTINRIKLILSLNYSNFIILQEQLWLLLTSTNSGTLSWSHVKGAGRQGQDKVWIPD